MGKLRITNYECERLINFFNSQFLIRNFPLHIINFINPIFGKM